MTVDQVQTGRRDLREVGIDVGALAELWRHIAEPGHPAPWPCAEGHDVVAVVLGVMRGDPEETLHQAGGRWGSVHRDTDTLAHRIDALRQILVERWPEEPETVHRVLDGITASAAMALSRRLDLDSHTDALTGVGNRRAFDESLGVAAATAARQQYGLSLVVADIDGLKRINDTAGHVEGDRVLVRFAQVVGAALRQGDRLYRLGGDEFAIIMPYCRATQTRTVMTRIQMRGSPAFSWGESSLPEDGMAPSTLFAVADAAMYRRKLRLACRPSGSLV